MHDLDLKNGQRSNVNMPVERPHATPYVLAMAMFAISVTVCKITTYSFQCTPFESLTLKIVKVIE